MSTQNNPTVIVQLDDGSGTWPIDVSSQVSLSAGIDVSGYGRADESTSATASQLTVTLKNNDGSFTTGVPGGFGGGGFGGGFFGGVVNLTKGQGIRYGLTLGASTRYFFTGRIDSFVQSFMGAPGKRSDITITALDAMSDYGKRPLRSMLEQEILLDSPTAYYTLGEATGSTTAGDTSGNGTSSLAVTGTGAAVVFGTATGPVDGLTAAQFANGMYLSAATTGTLVGTSSWSFEFFMAAATPASTSSVLQLRTRVGAGSGVFVFLTSAGLLSVFAPVSGGVLSSTSVGDGLTHHVAVTFDGTNMRLYIDGAVQSTSAVAAAPAALQYVVVGVDQQGVPGLGYVGSMSHLAFYPSTALSAGRAASHAAALTGFVETSDARISRLATYAGTTAITTTGSGQTMGSQDTTGAALLDAFGTVADTEGGFLYIDGSGQLRMQGRYYRAQKVTATLSVSGKAVDPGSFAVVDDTQQAMNQMTVTRIGGATQTWPLLTPAANVYPGSLDLAVDTDTNALTRAQWEVAKHSTPGPRLPSATTSNLRTSSSAAGIFARDLGDRLHFTGLPTTTNPNLTDVTIEGWSMHLDRDTWTYTYNLLPWSLAQVFTLDDTTYGVLDSTTPIGY